MMSSADPFQTAFANNFYLTEEWARFFQRVTNSPLESRTIGGAGLWVLKDKLVGISNFSDSLAASMKKQKIAYLRVLPVVNDECPRPSLIDYSIWFHRSYADAVNGYTCSFRKAVRQAEQHDIRISFHREYDAGLVDRVYPLYQRQMVRLNSFVFPKSFFENYMGMAGSFCIAIEYKADLIGYVFCVENGQNLYPSFGGVEAAFFYLRAVNRMYDSLIRYACDRGLNIHFGLGVHGAGFDRFKQDAGAALFKTERFPDHPLAVALMVKASKLKWYGRLLELLSHRFPKRIIYEMMPMT